MNDYPHYTFGSWLDMGALGEREIDVTYEIRGDDDGPVLTSVKTLETLGEEQVELVDALSNATLADLAEEAMDDYRDYERRQA